MEKLVGKLVIINKDVVFLADEHLGAVGIITKIINKMEKWELAGMHPDLLKHMIGLGDLYGQDMMFDVYLPTGEKLRLFYNEFTVME